MEARYYETEAKRSQPVEFLAGLELKFSAAIRADIALMEQHGDKAPVSIRPVTGYLPLWELRTLGYRAIFVRRTNVYWFLHICKKQDEKRGYELAWKRLQTLKG